MLFFQTITEFVLAAALAVASVNAYEECHIRIKYHSALSSMKAHRAGPQGRALLQKPARQLLR